MSIQKDSSTSKLTSSNLRDYSIGMVAVNKLRNSDIIEVAPLEKLTLLDGELTDHVEELSISGQSSTGSYNTQVKTTATIKAKWWPGENTNRRTPPDVRRGEKVRIIQFADDMTNFYWTTMEDSFQLRRLETSTMAWSADASNPPDPKNNNCYVSEVSTHDGLVSFTTSKANGEKFAYNVQINTKEGKVVITDDANNYIHINSNQDLIDLTNSRGTFLRLNGDDMQINVVGNLSIKVGGSSSTDVADSTNLTSGSSITNSSPTITEDGGNINLTGNISSSGGSHGGDGRMSMGGDVDMKNLDVTGDAKFSGVTYAKKVVSEEPIEAPNV